MSNYENGNGYIYDEDVLDMSDHVLTVNLNTIKDEIARRKQSLCNRFYEGQLVAVRTSRDNNYPARVIGINKASIKIKYLVDADFNETFSGRTVLISSEHIKGGWVQSAMPSAWIFGK